MAATKTVLYSYSTPAGNVTVYSDGSETISNGFLTQTVTTQNGKQSQTLSFGTAKKANTANNVVFTNNAGDVVDDPAECKWLISIAAPIVTQTLANSIGVAHAIQLSAFIWLSLILGYWFSHETRGTEIVDRVVKRPEMAPAMPALL